MGTILRLALDCAKFAYSYSSESLLLSSDEDPEDEDPSELLSSDPEDEEPDEEEPDDDTSSLP